MTDQTTDSQVLTSLLAEENLDGYTIKPWTIKQLLQVTPILKDVGEKLAEVGVTLETLSDMVVSQGVAGLAGLVDIILPHLPTFLAASLRISLEEAGEIDLGLSLVLVVKVLSLNIEHLKNSLSLVMREMTPLTGQMESTNN